MEKVQRILAGKWGWPLAAAVLVLGLAGVSGSLTGLLGRSDAAAASADRAFIDAESLKSFTIRLKPGMTIPVRSPYSGKDTGYPAELCYWTRDGQIKDTPTPVLLNAYRGRPEPTFCPDCGRLVVGHNPQPMAGAKPPPTAQEYHARHDYNTEDR